MCNLINTHTQARQNVGGSRVAGLESVEETTSGTVNVDPYTSKTATRKRGGKRRPLEGYRGAIENDKSMKRLIKGFRDNNH